MDISGYNIQIIDTFENDRVLVNERTELGAPKLQYNGSDDKYPPIVTSELTFNFSVPGAQDGKFLHLFTGNDTRYFVRLLNQDDVVLWTGFLMPDQYSEPYKAGHLFVNMTATDGIGRIKGKLLAWEYYDKETSVIKLIAECLKLTGLSQAINFSPAILPAAVDYRWDEIYVDGTTYRDDKEIEYGAWGVPLKLPKRKNAYEILELLLKSIGCTVFNWKNEWHIVGINRKHETEYEVYRYNSGGSFDGMATKTREVLNVVFETTPTVRMVSPWKRINITWAIDEDGNLLPDDIITEAKDKWNISTGNAFVDATAHGLPNEAPLKYWEPHGTIQYGVNTAEGKYLVDWSVPGSIPVPVAQGPFNLNIGKRYMSGGVSVSGETAAGTNVNYIILKKPKYLKATDNYIVRRLKFSVTVFGRGGSQEMIDDSSLQKVFRCEILVGDTVIVSNRPGGIGEVNFLFDLDWRSGNMEVLEENPGAQNVYVSTSNQVKGDIEKEDITVPHNGFLQLKFFAPVSINPASPVFYEQTFIKLEAEYTAQDEWYDALVRAIDFTTVYDLEYFHGDSIQDLSKKQFRFRRYIPIPDAANTEISVLSAQMVNTGIVTLYQFTVSYQQAQLILQNPALLYIIYDSVPVQVNSLYPSSATPFGLLWNVSEAGGIWKISLVVPVSGAHPVFGDISNFSGWYVNADIAANPAGYGWQTENNEWRESWKRYGYDENRRHGLCLGRIYHDVQPEPLAMFEGDILGIYGPDELLRKRWVDNKIFIPLRFTMDFSKGKTTGVVMMESKIANVSDYAAE